VAISAFRLGVTISVTSRWGVTTPAASPAAGEAGGACVIVGGGALSCAGEGRRVTRSAVLSSFDPSAAACGTSSQARAQVRA